MAQFIRVDWDDLSREKIGKENKTMTTLKSFSEIQSTTTEDMLTQHKNAIKKILKNEKAQKVAAARHKAAVKQRNADQKLARKTLRDVAKNGKNVDRVYAAQLLNRQ